MTQPSDIAALRLLLPFYVNGTLAVGLRTELDAALAGSVELRAELAALEDLRDQVREQGAALTPSDSERDVRLDAVAVRLPQPPPVQPSPPPEPLRSRVSAALAMLTPGRWIPAVALSLTLVIGGQSVALSRSRADNAQLGTQLAEMTEKYQSASGPCDDAAKAGRIAVELRDGANWGQIVELLDAEQLTIVSSGGFGTLTMASEAKGQALTDQIARLRKAATVASADAAT